VHHALCNVVQPIFGATFVHDSYACRPGKGTHAAIERFSDFSRRYGYLLKADIQKYFPSIDNQIIKSLFRRKIKNRQVLWLMDSTVDSSN